MPDDTKQIRATLNHWRVVLGQPLVVPEKLAAKLREMGFVDGEDFLAQTRLEVNDAK